MKSDYPTAGNARGINGILSFLSVIFLLVVFTQSIIAQCVDMTNCTLVFSDEFDGTTLDLTKWTPLVGDGSAQGIPGWGNNELQYYQPDNATVSGGFLTITAREEMVGGRNYTSSRLITENKADFTYGRMEMRARMPIGQGLWPAFWMFFTDPSGSVPAQGVYGGWAASGEIDIMEYLGNDPEDIFGTIHFGQPFPGNQFDSESFPNPTNINFNDDFHVFAIEWEPGEIRWYVDNILYATKNTWWSNGGNYPAPFDQDFHLLLNLAVGGNLPGNPDATTVFPQEFVIDYVRVYQSQDLPTASITSPANGDNPAAGPLTITADASANLGVSSVQFLQGDLVLGEDTTAPYELALPNVAEGPYRIRALVTDTAGNINYSDFVEINVGTSDQGPYAMQAAAIPGMIEAEDFDTGGQDIAINDGNPDDNLGSSALNNTYRNPDGVDIERTTDTGGGHNVAFVESGEWLEYTVNVQTAGNYDVVARVASQSATGSFNLEFNGVDKSGTINFPATGGSQTWVNVIKENVALDAGLQVMRLNMLSNGFNINKITFLPTDPSSGEKVVFDDMEHGNPEANGWFFFGGSVGGGGIGPNNADLPPENGGAFSLETGWGSGGIPGFFGGFGRTNLVDLSQTTYFNMWINPDAGQDYTLEINLQEDDNNDNSHTNAVDDEFRYNLKVGGTGSEVNPGGGWQLVSIPLADFFDNNAAAGNDVLDADPSGNGGLVQIVVVIVSNSGADASFRTDYWSFTNGPLGPEISVSPESHDFGGIGVTGTGSKAFTILNEGCTDLDISSTSLSGGDASEFDIASGAGPFTLAPGAQQVVEVEFNPTSLGLKSTDLIINSNDTDEGMTTIPLIGEGTDDPVINKVVFDDMEHGDPLNNGYFTFNGIASVNPTANSSDLPPENGGAFSLETNLSSGGSAGFFGGYGREMPVDLNTMTHFNFWINPDAGQDYRIEIQLQDDDNGDNAIPAPSSDDDEFQYNFDVNASGHAISGGGWQLISIPLTEFFDDNSFHNGGNAVFDPIAVANGGNGQLINVVFGFISNSGADITFRTDLWCFSEGPLGVTDPDIAVSPENHNYGPVFTGAVAQQAFQVLNNGGADLDVVSTTISGPDAGDFNILSGGAPFTIGIGGTGEIVVEFTPSSSGPKSAVLSIQSNDPDQPNLEIPLSGEGSDLNKIVFDDMEHGNPFGNDWFIFFGAGGGGLDPNDTDLAPLNGGAFSLQTGWGGAPGAFWGGFGRTKFLDLTDMDHFSLWINPNPGQEYVLEINLQEDDNGDNAINQPDDDEFQYNLTVGPEGSGAEVISGGGWQLVSIPFADFFDDNSFLFGGDGVLNPISTANGGNGQLVNVVFAVIGGTTGAPAEFRTDFWCFSEGPVEAKYVFDDFEHGDPNGNGWFFFGGSVGGGGIDPNFTDLPPIQGGMASMQTGWGSGGTPGFFGGFGRTNLLHLAEATHFNMWINPDGGQDYILEINLQDDDNGDNAFPFPAPDDDEWQYNLQVGGIGSEVVSGGGWQLVSIPLEDFFWDTSIHGGNGIFDPVPVGSGGNGQLINIVAAVVSNSGADATFRTDFWCFSDGPAELDCDPGFTVDLGEDQTAYLGYEPTETVTLTANVSGGAGPVNYLWSTGETTASIDVSPTELTTYSVFVYDGTGCNTVDDVTVDVVDVSCKNGKVLVCHKNKKTICINPDDVPNHLAHGDQLGSCAGELETEEAEEEDDDDEEEETTLGTYIDVSPNPFDEELEFQFGVENTTQVYLEVVNIFGQRIVTLFNGVADADKVYEIEWNTQFLNEGQYIYRFVTPDFTESKMVILSR